jgi:methyltransferase, FkbM family
MTARTTPSFLARLKRLPFRLLRNVIRRAPFLAPDRPSSLCIGTFDGFEVAYRRQTADQRVIRHSFKDDIFLSGVPEYQPRDGDVVIDIGAHIGTFSLLSSSKVGRHGRVHAIEACQDSFNLLRINVALNGSCNIFAHHLAISDRDGDCTLYHDAGNWGHSTVRPLSGSSEQTPCCTLGTFMDAHEIDQCDFMKMNCEGSEFPILLSTPADVLQRVRAMVVLYHCDLWSGNTPDDLVAHLQRSGFACTLRHRAEHRGWVIATRASQRTAVARDPEIVVERRVGWR